MKRFSAPASAHPDPSRPPEEGDDDSEISLCDVNKKVKTSPSFESLFNCESLSDIILNVNHGQFVFFAHKMIVGLKSERLAALITSVSTDNTSKPVLDLIEMPECGAVFSRFLYFIYSGSVWLHRDYVVPLLKLSVKYGVGALATHCENYLVQLLNKCLKADHVCVQPLPTLPVSTVCDLYEDDEYRDDTKRSAFCVLTRRFAELIRTERWISCTWMTVRDLLSCDECVCEENIILVAATDWMKRNKLQDKARIQEILSSIRYPKLPRRVLYHLYTTASFKNFPQVQDLIQAAICYHCFKDVPEAQDEFEGSQYRARGWSRTRHIVCGVGSLPKSQTADNFVHKNKLDYNDECEEIEPNSEHIHVYNNLHQCGTSHPDIMTRSREIIHNHHHHLCHIHAAQAARNTQRRSSRTCWHHRASPEILPAFDPDLSTLAAVQSNVHCQPNLSQDTEPSNASHDISLHININSNNLV